MKLLLDTHLFLWLLLDDPRLPADVRAAVRDPASEVAVSIAAIWEAVIKYALGKLPLPGPPEVYLPVDRVRLRVDLLHVEEDDMPHLVGLPPLHKDPFDRFMVAQALRHGFTLATVDAAVRAYPVPILPVR